ncbi:MAG TPA: helix-turn-helix domain-containing protein, partial [bacterium]|nr:helix-turn-helix domain-containing protein [bacterium]
HLQNRTVAGVSDEVMAALMDHDYPGNVRELENIIEQGFVLCRGEIVELDHLPPELRARRGEARAGRRTLSLAGMERALISEALARTGGNRRTAALELGIDPSTLYRKIKSLGIRPPARDGRGRRQD